MIHMMWWYDLTYTTYDMMQADMMQTDMVCYFGTICVSVSMSLYRGITMAWKRGRAPWFDAVMMKIFDAIHGDKMWYDEMILK